jgi:hypothetical protein
MFNHIIEYIYPCLIVNLSVEYRPHGLAGADGGSGGATRAGNLSGDCQLRYRLA